MTADPAPTPRALSTADLDLLEQELNDCSIGAVNIKTAFRLVRWARSELARRASAPEPSLDEIADAAKRLIRANGYGHTLPKEPVDAEPEGQKLTDAATKDNRITDLPVDAGAVLSAMERSDDATPADTWDYAWGLKDGIEQGKALARPTAPADARTCTCHPDDSPPRPCPHRYALNECRAAADAQGDAARLRPMSEAPRDGRMILSRNRHGAVETIMWNEHEQAWDDGFGYREFEPFAVYEPPGWLPIPAALQPPAAPAGEDELQNADAYLPQAVRKLSRALAKFREVCADSAVQGATEFERRASQGEIDDRAAEVFHEELSDFGCVEAVAVLEALAARSAKPGATSPGAGGDMLWRNPAPNASPVRGPSGRFVTLGPDGIALTTPAADKQGGEGS